MSAVRSLPVLTNETPKICGDCGGKCCKRMPGIVSPEDVGAPDRDAMRARLVEMLSSGRYAIDWWEGDPRRDRDNDSDDYAEYVRPAVKGYEGQLRHASWGGNCTFLRPDGCSLSFDDRPTNCRELVANPEKPGRDCRLPEGRDKRAYVLAWLPYHDLLDEAANLRTTHDPTRKDDDAR